MGYKEKYKDVKRVYCDLETGMVSNARVTRFQTRFDSTSEYKCYLLLRDYFPANRFVVNVHPTIQMGFHPWEIDFSVSTTEHDYDAQVILASIVNTLHGTQYKVLREVFFEYKGLQDDNFIRQMTNIAKNAPLFGNSIILLSDKCSAFGCWDSTRKKFYCHPIASMYIIEEIFKLHIQLP